MLYGKFSYQHPELLKRKLGVIIQDPVVEAHLQRYVDTIGPDYEAYRGHVYRVLSYSLHFLSEEEGQQYRKVIAAALVYHDIGLWTDGTLAYLEPSRDQAEADLGSEFTAAELQLIGDIIYWHHKVTPFEGEYANVVNAVRKADWIDATRGLVPYGMPRVHIKDCVASLPYNGFHDVLMGFGSKLYGNDIVRIVKELSSIYKY